MSRELRAAAHHLDRAAYQSIARTTSPGLDQGLATVSRCADRSRIWLACSALLGAIGGSEGRAAAKTGLAAIGVTSTIVNLALKPIARRRRPDRAAHEVAATRHVPMPVSTSFPSGHSASAFAFATAAGAVLPRAAAPLRALATLVAYSRVHTGVHYPGDVLAGSLIGALGGRMTARHVRRRAG